MAVKKTGNKKTVTKEPVSTPESNSKSVWGWLLIGLGLLFFLRDVVGFELSRTWPIILIGVGAYLLWFKKE